MSVSQSNIPLPSSPPPPPPPTSGSTGSPSTQIPPLNMPPPTAAAYQQYYQQYYQYMYMYNNPATAAAMMQAYHPQMMAAVNPAAGQAAVAAAMQGYYNYNPATAQKPAAVNISTPPPPKPAQKPTEPEKATTTTTNESTKTQIKINLKFQQQSGTEKVDSTSSIDSTSAKQQTIGRKSRFSTNIESLTNVTSEQEKFKHQQQQQQLEQTSPKDKKQDESNQKAEEETSKKQDTTVSEIVYDINKWPVALKNYCAKVYQHFQAITLVSEDQVTKYLQKRITDAFKLKPDLNIGWEQEPLPDIISIKKVAPFSQQQLQQQQRQQQLAIQQKKLQIQAQQQAKLKQESLAAAEALKQQNQSIKGVLGQANKLNKKFSQTSLISTIKENLSEKKRKTRSRSSSSTSSRSSSESSKKKSLSSSSSSSSDENFISFTKTKKPTNLKRKAESDEEFEEEENDDKMILDEDKYNDKINFNKLTKKQRRKLMLKQKKQQLHQQQQQQHFQKQKQQNFFLNNKNNFYDSTNSLNTIRKQMKNIFELAKEQDMEHDEAMHHKNICIGLSQDLEKEYLRLTGPPEPSVVRPLEVLKKSLDYVLLKYSKTNDYRYICDQMKAIRQDLTVQQIRNEFTIQVYETHARIAIKNKDRDEFNQCQNQLKSLYNLVSFKTINLNEYSDNSSEFIGYRLLYNMLTKSYKDIDQVIKEIKQKYSLDETLKHLLELKKAWELNNYIKFFKLYKKSNTLCKCMIDLFIERERKQALKRIIKSYRPSIKLEIVSDMLAYESVDKCKSDLIEYKINLIEDSLNSTTNELYIDCKSCTALNF